MQVEFLGVQELLQISCKCDGKHFHNVYLVPAGSLPGLEVIPPDGVRVGERHAAQNEIALVLEPVGKLGKVVNNLKRTKVE